MNQSLVYQYVPNPFRLKLLDVSGIAVNSKNQIFFSTRTTPGKAAPIMMLEPDGKFFRGFGGQVLRNAHGICIDAEDNIFVVDPMRNCVFKFSPDGELLSTIGEPDAPLSTSCVNYDIFVVDGYGNSRVHHFSPDGRLIQSWGQPGTGPGEFNIPHGIGIDLSNDDIYVADRENFRIQIFDCEGNL
jgi:sugar lactone lactonase YvrE